MEGAKFFRVLLPPLALASGLHWRACACGVPQRPGAGNQSAPRGRRGGTRAEKQASRRSAYVRHTWRGCCTRRRGRGAARGLRMATPRDALAPHAPAALPAAAPSALAPGLSRKLRKVLETRTDSADVLTALEALGELFPDNTAAARRGLRATVEAQGLAINEALVAAAEPVQARRWGLSAPSEGAGRRTSAR